MPHKPLKPCRYAGCPNLTDGYFCPIHKKLEDQKEKLRQEIEAEKEKIEAIQEIQPDTVDEPYYPEVKYFNK